MVDFLYRFRSIEALLDKYNELENQEIYFSSSTELNDPMEGFKAAFWKGDKIVWTNFLKNYLLCLFSTGYLYKMSDQELDESQINPQITIDNLPDAPVKEKYKELCQIFFNNEKINEYIAWLSSQNREIKINELVYHLMNFHAYATICIEMVNSEQNSVGTNYVLVKSISEKLFNHGLFQKLGDMINNDDIDDLYFMPFHLIKNSKLLGFSSKTIKHFNLKFFYFDFPEKYVNQLINKVMYFEWYAACFLSDYTNPAMWGYYGDSHKGVCLKFKTRSNKEGKPTIKLTGLSGFSASKQGSKPSYSSSEKTFYKISYCEDYPKADFFRSLGQLSIPTIMNHWYKDENDNLSICADVIKPENYDNFHKSYWEAIQKCSITKLPGWAHENEYRLTLIPLTFDFSKSDKRKFKYHFSDLEGIIFGVKTPLKDKLKIIEIIKNKCLKEKRKDFKFYQAYFSQSKKEVQVLELPTFYDEQTGISFAAMNEANLFQLITTVV